MKTNPSFGFAALGLLILLLAGCGFHLRGKAQLPPALKVTHIQGPGGPGAPPSELARTLQRILETNSVRVTSDPAAATATVAIRGEDFRRRTLAVDKNGNAREYELTYRVDFDVSKSDGSVLLAPQTISVSRDLLYEEARVLGKAEGEQLIIRNMESDVAWSIVRRLQMAGP